jgi:Flp pilus assembly protein TadG
MRALRARSEQGQMLAILALALVMICGFVALAVDLGNVGQTHQHGQNAVDAAAVSGAQELGTDQCTGCTGNGTVNSGDLTAIVTSIEGYLTSNFSGAGNAGWNDCPSITPPAGSEAISWMSPPPNDSNGPQNCVNFGTGAGSSQTNTVRVQLPPQLVKFAFGQVGNGKTGQQISTVAYASVLNASSIGTLPIGVGTDSAGSGYTCIKGGNGKASCTNGLPPSAQGVVVNPRYRVFPNAPDNGGGNNNAVEIDLALGTDHLLQAFDPAAPVHYCDAMDSPATSQCKSPFISDSVSPADWDLSSLIYLASGNTNNTVQNGLACGDTSVDTVDGVNVLAPRLAHNANDTNPDTSNPNPAETPATPTISSTPFCNKPVSPNLDGRQISCYLTSLCGATGAPLPGGTALYNNAYGSTTTCTPGTSPDPSTTDVQNAAWSNGATCLAAALVADSGTAWTAVQNKQTPVPDFPQSIVNSPRFALVPVVPKNCTGMCEITPDPPVAPYGFAAVYLDAAFIQGGDFSIEAFVFSPLLVQGGPFIGGGASTSGFSGTGPFVVNLCSPTGSGGSGNC